MNNPFSSLSYPLRPMLNRLVTALLSIMVTACGFQLRGLPDAQFHTLYIDGVLGAPADQELHQELLHQTHLVLVKQASQADVILHVSPIRNTQQILSLNAVGTVTQYTLYSRLSYRATDNLENELIPPSSLTVSRLFNYNIAQILGKPAEQTLLNKDMEIDLVHQMMRRVLSLHPTLGHADAVPQAHASHP